MATLVIFDHKECIRCLSTFPLTGFYAHRGMADGLLNACKACIKVSATVWGRSHKLSRKRITARHEAKDPQGYCQRRGWSIKQVPSWYAELDAFVWEEIQVLARLRSDITGVTQEVDHIIPGKGRLVSGLHCYSNWRVVPKTANLTKWANIEASH